MKSTENILYILGAGFSAPVGLPVMSNFIFKAKDLFAREPEKFAYFREIFKEMDRMSKAKSFIEYDLLNIEDVLSVLEMKSTVYGAGSKRMSKMFRQFVADVITAHTRPIEICNDGHWIWQVFGANAPLPQYGMFLANILKMQLLVEEQSNRSRFLEIRKSDRLVRNYSVITFNYDMILENALTHLLLTSWNRPSFKIDRALDKGQTLFHDPLTLHYAKLHGSCDDPETIITPTWNKIRFDSHNKAWRMAFEMIKSANFIRFIGYSLPDTDNYFKYLLISALNESYNLKGIDIICLDLDGSVKNRYDRILKFREKRFVSFDIAAYLRKLSGGIPEEPYGTAMAHHMSNLERVHDSFMEKPGED